MASQCDLRDIVHDAFGAVACRASAQHSMRLELPSAPVPAVVDRERLVLAIRNLVDNAVKYSPEGGEVLCSLSRDDQRALVRVSDHGLGIAPEDRQKLFTRFGRILTTTNSHIPGIGLGLYLTREVARRHGGDAALVEGEDGCTVFEITLPLHG